MAIPRVLVASCYQIHKHLTVRNPTGQPGGPIGFGGEFDPGSGSTLAARLMHASRTGSSSGDSRGGRARNTWATCPGVGGSRRKRRVIPRTLTG